MLIVTTSDIADQAGKPNRQLLNRYRIPSQFIDRILLDDWSGGCGVHNVYGHDGKISFTLIFGDVRLPTERLRTCVVTAIIYAFGLRTGIRLFIPDVGDYVQFLFLAREVRKCNEELQRSKTTSSGPVNKAAYVECAAQGLNAKLDK